ncbi:hypothetical protein [Gimesia aquarii]|uniref:Uncharacterized protein n=1 Tax=Gimesia aquarii TaxID=2527964 RepID=A0A517VYC1_9PLAN|nr:hypothetical protein [Gimesia aquarii]QDT97999.1 hypothetical protein V144x_34820 [Gimesia aquarii]
MTKCCNIRQIGFALLLLIFLTSQSKIACSQVKASESESTNNNSHLKYFGFTLIDVGWDDPTDKNHKTNYIDEVAPFCNVADMLVVSPDESIIPRLQLFSKHRVKAILHLHELFFQRAGNNAPSGAAFDLRKDYRQRWDKWIAVNELKKNHSLMQALYIGEEPTWNGITFEELSAACDYIKSSLPQSAETAILVVEAYPAIKDLKVPQSVDWLGFDHYFIKSPATSQKLKNELALLKSKRSSLHQRIVLIPDAHFIPQIHTHFGVKETDMKAIATAYYQMACADTDIVALLAYFWPGGFDSPHAKGTRNLNSQVIDEYKRIGREITNKTSSSK